MRRFAFALGVAAVACAAGVAPATATTSGKLCVQARRPAATRRCRPRSIGA